MTKEDFTHAVEVYRMDLERGEDRSAATLQRVLRSRSRQRRIRPLIWAAVLTCSGVAAASIRQLPGVYSLIGWDRDSEADFLRVPVVRSPTPRPTPAVTPGRVVASLPAMVQAVPIGLPGLSSTESA